MTAQILSAAPVVEKIKKDLTFRCASLKQRGVIPSMCVVLVGDNPASLSYIRNKRKMCEEIGAHFHLEHMATDISPEVFCQRLDELNNDNNIHGIIIQLPVPEQLKSLNLPNMVNPGKDIDGFHGFNTQKIYQGTRDLSYLIPCTPKGVVKMLQFYGVEIKGKNIVVVGRSLIVGKPMSMLLSNFDATVTLAHSQTRDIRSYTRDADIVIAAIGKAHFFDNSFFDPAKRTVVIDVGMNSLDGKLTGDVKFEEVKEVTGSITPVPGGVGPMTVVSLIDNLISAVELKVKG